jgi:hypothetical protein
LEQRTKPSFLDGRAFQRYCYAGELLFPAARIVAHEVKALENSVFGPCTPAAAGAGDANMGHLSRTKDLGWEMKSTSPWQLVSWRRE